MIHDVVLLLFFFFKQKTAYEMRISDWSSDVCSSDLGTKTATAHLFRNLGKGYEPIGMLKLRDKDLSSWLWYNKGDALPTARDITENLRRGTEYSAPADDERWIAGEIIGCQNNADHIEFDLDRKNVVEGKSVSGRVELGGR